MKNYLFILNFIAISLFAQQEISDLNPLTNKVYDAELNIINLSNSRLCKKPLIIVTSLNCSDCVKYFAMSSKFRFLFILNSESLSEINRLLSTYNLSSKNCYFVMRENLVNYKNLIIKGPTPAMILKKEDHFEFYNFVKVDSLTIGFTDKKYSFLKVK